MTGVIFRDPEQDEPVYLPADEYLSGNVRQKLAVARLAAASDPDYQVNVKALEQVQPRDLDASEIAVRLGATWIPPKYIQDFLIHCTNLKDHNGPGISSGAWSIAGGVLIIAVATYFGTLTVRNTLGTFRHKQDSTLVAEQATTFSACLFLCVNI